MNTIYGPDRWNPKIVPLMVIDSIVGRRP